MIKVLYVEDNDDHVYMLKMRLEILDEFEILVADDGEKGCKMAAAEEPDIILMDLENTRMRSCRRLSPPHSPHPLTQRAKKMSSCRPIPRR